MSANQYLNYKHIATEYFQVPCGECQACRIATAQEWTGRIVMETTQWSENYFLTLTYEDKHLPLAEYVTDYGEYIQEMTLRKKDVQLFMKRLRKQWKKKHACENIRFYCGAEYGEKGGRPHYHICLFNCPIFDLKETGEKNDIGQPYYWSKEIEDLWSKGETKIGELNAKSAGYTARYVMKKWKGRNGKEEWEKEHAKEREFSLMSRKPGIGYKYFEEHKEKMLRDGEILVSTWAGSTRATTPKSFVYRCRNPGITAKDGKMRVSEEEDKHNRELGRQLAKQKNRTIDSKEQSQLNVSSLDMESIIRNANEAMEQRILALRQKGLS